MPGVLLYIACRRALFSTLFYEKKERCLGFSWTVPAVQGNAAGSVAKRFKIQGKGRL